MLISLSSEKIISRNSSLPGVGSISNVDFLYKCRFLLQKGISTLFSELLLYLQFLKNNQFKLILMPKRHILGWHILLPFKMLPCFYYNKPQQVLLLSNTTSGVQHTVRPNKPKCQSLEQRMVYCKGQAKRAGGLCSKDLNSPMDLREEFFFLL